MSMYVHVCSCHGSVLCMLMHLPQVDNTHSRVTVAAAAASDGSLVQLSTLDLDTEKAYMTWP